MTAYFLYLIEASVCLILLYVVYLLFLRKETYHHLKRYYLLLSLTFSMVIPLLPSIAYFGNQDSSNNRKYTYQDESITMYRYRDNFDKFLYTTLNEKFETELSQNDNEVLQKSFYLFLISSGIIMLFRFLSNCYSLRRLIKNSPVIPYGKFRIVRMEKDHPPFSFLNYIFISNGLLSSPDSRYILLHEEAHLKQKHSYDILFLELAKLILWFNPVIWHLKSSMVKVHEYLADHSLVRHTEINLSDYQSILLHQYLSNFNIELAHPFNYSLIKNRIKMMTQTKSKWWAKYKVLFALPFLFLGIFAFTNKSFHFVKTKTSLPVLTRWDNAPKGWKFHVPDNSGFFVCGIANETAQHGKKSAFLESVKDKTHRFANLLQNCCNKQFYGQRVKLTCFVKTQGNTDTARVWVRVDNVKTKQAVEFDNMWERPLIGIKDWKKVEIVFDVPEDGVIFYGLVMHGVGKVWVDNFSFEIVDKTNEKTTTAMNTPIKFEPFLKELEKYPNGFPEKPPVNLDFEE